MRITILAAAVVIAVATLVAGNPPDNTKSTPAFDKLKSLVGIWQGKDGEGKPVTISYKMVSAGTSLMETLDMADTKEAMITMYHLDGSKVMMTHYCSMGNQPRMRTTGLSKDGQKLSFKFVDVTNHATPEENYMRGLVFTFKDADHFAQEWTMRMEGKTDHPSSFEFARSK
ncbi:MAG: hypothetical protein HY033_12300 [Ignavibacteriae bacterium]|nr:hypothetical protein [Ignavibacteria bacterium]MBI3365673.1 hypothetical protein [Ignavibacteriota bacterium]